MPIARRRIQVPFPLLAILTSVLTLLVLLTVFTYRNLDRERRRNEEFLLQQGAVLIRGLEAGARTGMMRMAWQEELLQTLVEEITRSAGLAGVRILESDGRAVAESHAVGVSLPLSSPVPVSEILEGQEPRGWRQDRLYVVGKRFVPVLAGTGLGYGPGMGHGPGAAFGPGLGQGPGMGFGSGGGRGGPRSTPPPRVILVGMFLEPYLEAQREDVRRAILMGVVLLLIGSASFYFIFVVQNLRLVRRTLREMTTYTGHLVEHMPDGLISVNPEGEMVTVNGKARELLGPSGPLAGKSLISLGPPWEGFFQRAQAGERVLEEEIETRTSGGQVFPVAISATRVMGGDGEDLGVVILIRDLREVRTLQEELRRSERLASVGQLAAGVAHEIRNPLSSIRGFAQLFRKRFDEGSEDRRFAEIMVHEVDRLNRVIANLLDFARPKDPLLREMRPRETVDHAVDLLRQDSEARRVAIKVDGDVSPQRYDPDQMTQALLNLLLNGLEAVAEGGEVRVKLGEVPERSGWVLDVGDTGPGIPRELIPRLFDPFFTTKKRGTGLGLAMVHRIVENHRGSIEVKSEVGKGTRFILRFPSSDVAGMSK
jgi:two-component system, NtrC family, sensor histidine kinase HydH